MKLIENLPGEEWKSIAGYVGLYEISNCGRVKSTKFKLHRILSPNAKVTKSSRYIKVRLFDKNGNEKIFPIHRLVAMYFVPNPESKPEVNHLDGNRNNCHYTNLEWSTHHENTLHGQLASRKNKSSRFKGVSMRKNRTCVTWRWAIFFKGKHERRFGFKTEEEAFNDLKQFYEDNGISGRYLE
jgi:hypothetical protein